MRFDFSIGHVPGKNLYTADSLSRAPLKREAWETEESKHNNDFQKEVECYVNTVLINWPASDQILDEIRSELKKDDTQCCDAVYTVGMAHRQVKDLWPTSKIWE